MAVPLAGDPELIDPHGGLEDLGRGGLRVLHPGSFEDDPTRAVRAARYAARYGFALERSTAELIRRADLATVSGDRAEAELRKLAAEPEAPGPSSCWANGGCSSFAPRLWSWRPPWAS